MNVTDVDDKIIVRARRNWLLDRYQTRSADVAAVRAQPSPPGSAACVMPAERPEPSQEPALRQATFG